MFGWVNPTSMVQRADVGPKEPETVEGPCCAWCGRLLPDGCPSDDFDRDACEQRWREWRNGPVPDNPPPNYRLTIHLDGIPWDTAPVPHPIHQCWPQSSTVANAMQRCPCGASRHWEGDWTGKNSRTEQRAA